MTGMRNALKFNPVGRWILVIAVLVALVVIAARYASPLFDRPYTFHGSRFDPPPLAPDFTLIDQEGRSVRLSDYRGRLVLLFFGYTHCPDVCPTTLAKLRYALQELGEVAREVQVIFISVDPERDTPEVVKRYLSHFDPTFVGLTGRPEEIEAVTQAYGVYVEKEEVGSAAGYLITHSARTYVIDREGRLVLTFIYETEPQDIVADLKQLLRR
ncbi:MAG: SCO family protein [Anaerolineae bacterium]|nr:SCO family protein [Anaerolineae bacterium]MDW8098947.1 SCO family protein [Anaerolineae bacterium]